MRRKNGVFTMERNWPTLADVCEAADTCEIRPPKARGRAVIPAEAYEAYDNLTSRVLASAGFTGNEYEPRVPTPRELELQREQRIKMDALWNFNHTRLTYFPPALRTWREEHGCEDVEVAVLQGTYNALRREFEPRIPEWLKPRPEPEEPNIGSGILAYGLLPKNEQDRL